MDRFLGITLDAIGPLFNSLITMTIPLAIISFIFGIVIAVFTAVARVSKLKILSIVAYLYVWIFRGTPLLVQLFIVFFGLPTIGIQFNAFIAAVITFSLNTGAYASETIRSSILAIPRGQIDSALSIGMSRFQILSRIVAPQALKIALPPLSNTLISLVKDTSLASSITVVEMFMTAQRIAAVTYEPLLLYCLVALYYLLICTLLNILQFLLERRLNRF